MWYHLANDEQTWDRYASATTLPYYYHVNILDVISAKKFSPLILQLKCTTKNPFDACCMISDEEGAVCLVRGEELDDLRTYRYTYTEWTTQVADALMRPVLSYQDKFKETLPEPIQLHEEDFNTYAYMHYFACAALEATKQSQTFKCTVYQPDWEGRGEDGISDGYPRFGTKEREQFAAFFDAKSYKVRPEFYRLELELGATALLVGCAATLALLF